MTVVNKMQRYSISVSGETYERMRSMVGGNIAPFVDDVVRTALDDPSILARLLPRCRQKPAKKPPKTAQEPTP